MTDQVRVRLRIYGRVQGVNFRNTAARRAKGLNLAGWIANKPDGSVETVAQGAREQIDLFISWAQRGPSLADVERVDVQEEQAGSDIRSYRIVD